MKKSYFITIIISVLTMFMSSCMSKDFSQEKKQFTKSISSDDFSEILNTITQDTYSNEFEYMTYSWNNNRIYKDIRIVEANGKSILIYQASDCDTGIFMLLEKDMYLSFINEFKSIYALHTVSEYQPGETSGYNSGIESFMIRFTGNNIPDGNIVEINRAMLKPDDYRYRLRQLFENFSRYIHF
ncbi:MAG: hypothetical protein J6Y16_00075 [Treponema sp.]|nr:hypothetical protein [Treponema sp.]